MPDRLFRLKQCLRQGSVSRPTRSRETRVHKTRLSHRRRCLARLARWSTTCAIVSRGVVHGPDSCGRRLLREPLFQPCVCRRDHGWVSYIGRWKKKRGERETIENTRRILTWTVKALGLGRRTYGARITKCIRFSVVIFLFDNLLCDIVW